MMTEKEKQQQWKKTKVNQLGKYFSRKSFLKPKQTVQNDETFKKFFFETVC